MVSKLLRAIFKLVKRIGLACNPFIREGKKIMNSTATATGRLQISAPAVMPTLPSIAAAKFSYYNIF
jgi:hypothetical protein